MTGRPAREPDGPGARSLIEPERDTRGALSRLVEVLLDKGVYLDLDLVVTVAEVPLIAVDIRAAIAGVETMIEYGFQGPWTTTADPVDRPAGRASTDGAAIAVRSGARYLEARAGGPVWRDGTLTVERSGDVRWQGDGDRRPSLHVTRPEVVSARLRPAAEPGDDAVVELVTVAGVVELAGAGADRWLPLLVPDSAEQDGGGP